MDQDFTKFWSIPDDNIFKTLKSSKEGLTSADAVERLKTYGSNSLKPPKRSDAFTLLISQFKSPIIIILLFAIGLSFYLHDTTDAVIILTIVLISGLLGFWQERGAANAVAKLLDIVRINAMVKRDGNASEIPVENIVPGDIVVLNAGDVIPGDCRILESKDLFVDEATLTGETYPVEKSQSVIAEDSPLNQRTNSLWMGTHVVSGTADALVILTGKNTEFGKVSEHLKLRPLETEFERGIRRFGFFLMEVTLTLVVGIFVINVFLAKPVLDSFLFSLALAVGLTPQLLPAIISINLSHGAKRMAQQKVIVKRLNSIENFGSMNVICSDKTGTLTEGVVHLESTLDSMGKPSDKVLLYSYINSCYETGFLNPIDEAVRKYKKLDIDAYKKYDEIPYDFLRKRLTILVSNNDKYLMITKGALTNVLDVCKSAEMSDGSIIDIEKARAGIMKQYEDNSNKGFRTLGVAYKNLDTMTVKMEHEEEMTFLGFLVLSDPLKADIMKIITNLKQLGVQLKVITGDNHLVASNISQQLGLAQKRILTGPELHQMSDGALLKVVNEVDIYAEIEPNQKERIIVYLKKAGNVVGYMGDGINDASALHSADVGISVESAVDVAKEAADIVLLEKDLGVLVNGVEEGRRTFANTLKYVFMATSANFGNMFSMAGASLFMSFLPLLPKQILLTNLLTDFPEMTIATDNVDDEMIMAPRRWDIKAIRKFMLTFGLLSSVFDYITFGFLLLIMKASPETFRTGWFIESVVSAAMIVLVIRSRQPFFKSKPGKYLLIATLFVVAVTFIFPFLPFDTIFGFDPLPLPILGALIVIIGMYVLSAEVVKKAFYKMVKM